MDFVFSALAAIVIGYFWYRTLKFLTERPFKQRGVILWVFIIIWIAIGVSALLEPQYLLENNRLISVILGFSAALITLRFWYVQAQGRDRAIPWKGSVLEIRPARRLDGDVKVVMVLSAEKSDGSIKRLFVPTDVSKRMNEGSDYTFYLGQRSSEFVDVEI